MAKIIHFFVFHPRDTYIIRVNLRCGHHLKSVTQPNQKYSSNESTNNYITKSFYKPKQM